MVLPKYPSDPEKTRDLMNAYYGASAEKKEVLFLRAMTRRGAGSAICGVRGWWEVCGGRRGCGGGLAGGCPRIGADPENPENLGVD